MTETTQTPTINIAVHNQQVPLYYDSNLTFEQAKLCIECTPFKDWLALVNKDKRFDVKGIRIQGVDFFGPRVGFMKFKTDIVNEDGILIPGVVFMRGGAVGILVILSCQGQEYTIITLQPRVPTGFFQFPEIPAGMLDHSGDFAGVAAKELKEECDISIAVKDLVDLTELAYGSRFKGMYPSAGGCDEFIRLFVYHEEVTRDRLQDLKGKLTGDREHGETITLKIVPLRDLWKEAPDAKALSALQLYEMLKNHPLIVDKRNRLSVKKTYKPLVYRNNCKRSANPNQQKS